MAIRSKDFAKIINARATYWIVVFICVILGVIAMLFTDNINDRVPLYIALSVAFVIVILYRIALLTTIHKT